ncbi:hypothetical protein BJ165DRAFT_1597418 [Panaeolus papilionaceus]|nr:hypothetical protein BJ165DRAFT_1597418 [Panaeolus papilionaceus]
MKFFIALFTLSSARGALAVPVDTAAPQIVSRINELSSQVVILNDAVKALESNNSETALAVHNEASKILQTITSASEEAKVTIPKPAFSTDGMTCILLVAQDFQTISMATLRNFGINRNVFDAFTNPGSLNLVRQDLVDMRDATERFQTLVMSTAGDDDKGPFTPIIQIIKQALDSAVVDYTHEN